MASVEIMLRFKEKDRDKKNKKAAFTVAWMKFLLNFQAQKTTQERIIVGKVFVISPKYDNLHSWDSPRSYDIIQIEVSRKKLESSASVVSSSSKTETQRGKRGILQIWWHRAKSSNQAAKTNIDIGWEKRKSKFVRTKNENPNCPFQWP